MGSALGRLMATVGLVVLTALVSSADPAGAGHLLVGYRFDGGTVSQRSQVRAALRASSFDWSVVPAVVTVHIVRGLGNSEAAPGEIWLDADLLDSGTFAWGVVQHEYAHQVDFFVLDDHVRACSCESSEASTGGAAPELSGIPTRRRSDSHPRSHGRTGLIV